MKIDTFLENTMPMQSAGSPNMKSQKIDNVSKDMESLFLHQMIKSMRQASGSSGDKGFGASTYSDMFDMELANIMSERGIGVNDVVSEQLNRQGENSDSNDMQNKSYNIPVSQSIKSRVRASYKTASGSYDTAKIIKDLDRSISESIDKAQPMRAGMPVKGKISSEYGMRIHPISGELKFHHGMDIAAKIGTPIHPVKAGEVIFSGEQHGYGNVVIIKHEDGYITKYAHCEKNLVSKGDMVDVNTVIGKVGESGESTGPHLHFEVAHNGKSINPREIFV
ncbi:MAG: peptidoglycan DD-metalloendopeptidase family protein [Nitrospirae bacterium]|nr:peptidoglycan DD-metalloendopeptidase family protein [Nitrospirota bacterium]